MKLTILMLFLFIFSAHATGVAQSVTLHGKALTYQQIFAEIKKQTGYFVFGSKDLVKSKEKVSLNVSKVPLEEFLVLLFEQQPYDYAIEGKTVFLFRKDEPAGMNFAKITSPQPVSGRITDSLGNPIQGASVRLMPGNKGVFSGADGSFIINNVASGKYTLEISFIGYASVKRSITVPEDSPLMVGTILLKASVLMAEEVVVSTGYWTTTKRLSTGSISKITSKEIRNQPVTSPLMALQGRVPGMDITPTSGMPGSAVKVQIRGQNSLRGGDYPLYVIDGVPIDSRPLETSRQSSVALFPRGIDPLSAIDPDNIESIEILKDADATAIYGSRGANGVILITTKKTRNNNDLSTNISAYKGVGHLTNRLDLLNRQQYLAMRKEALANDGLSPMWFDYDINGSWDTTRSTDWQDVLLGGTANITDVSAGLSNGGQQTSFDLNLSYHKESLITPGNFGSTQLSGRFSMNHHSKNNRLTLIFSTQYAHNKTMYAGDQNLVGQALKLSPNAPALYNADGSLNWQIIAPFNNNYRLASWLNPLSAVLNTKNIINNNFIATASLNYNIFPGLDIKVSSGITNGITDDIAKFPIAASSPTVMFTTGGATFSGNRRSTWNIEPSLNYQKIFSDHSINAVVGTTIQQNRSEFNSVTGSGYTSDALLKSIMAAPTKQYFIDDEMYRYMAAYARVGYDYKQKYIVNFTGRRDGSSRFGPGNRVSNFGSIGAAWIISDENFLRSSSFVDFAKIRGSLGVTGSENIGSYGFLETYDIAEYFYQGFAVLNPSSLYNDKLAWEKTKKTELALELGFFNNALFIEATAYKNTSSNQLVSYGLPYISGFPSVDLNLDAVIQNTGLEFSVTTKNLMRSNFQWTSSANLSFPHNKLIRYNNIEQSSYAQRYKVGEPLSIQRLFKWKGVDPATGDNIFEDTNGDGSITDDDKVFMSPLAREFYGGVNNSFVYKNFELSFLFQFSKAIQFGHFTPYPGELGNQPKWVLERWQDNKTITNVPKFTTMGYLFSEKLNRSDYNTRNTYFVRLKTLSLNYRIPAPLLRSVHLKSANLFLQAQNLFTLTNYKLVLDPETGNGLPPLRMITAGFNVKL